MREPVGGGKTVLLSYIHATYIILGGRDPYGTGGVRRRCYDIHVIASLQMIENEWLCVIQMCMCMCVCDTRGMLNVYRI